MTFWNADEERARIASFEARIARGFEEPYAEANERIAQTNLAKAGPASLGSRLERRVRRSRLSSRPKHQPPQEFPLPR